MEGQRIKGEEGRNVSQVAMRLAPATAAQRTPVMMQRTLSDSIGAGNEDAPILISPQRQRPHEYILIYSASSFWFLCIRAALTTAGPVRGEMKPWGREAALGAWEEPLPACSNTTRKSLLGGKFQWRDYTPPQKNQKSEHLDVRVSSACDVSTAALFHFVYTAAAFSRSAWKGE